MKPCEVCGLLEARYVCNKCGRSACSDCFSAATWTCKKCSEMDIRKREGSSPIAIKLLFAGFLLVFSGMILVAISAFTNASSGASAGGIIMIGPIPIIFGTDGGAIWPLAILVLILMLSFFVMTLILPRYLSRKSQNEDI